MREAISVTAPVLSIWQPWAYAICCCGKRVENRGYATPYRGKVLLHATKTKQGMIDLVGYPHDLYVEDGEGELYSFDPDAPAASFGAIVGCADLVFTHCDHDKMRAVNKFPHLADGITNWHNGGWGWVLDNVQVFARAIPWKGSQGFRYNVIETVECEVLKGVNNAGD